MRVPLLWELERFVLSFLFFLQKGVQLARQVAFEYMNRVMIWMESQRIACTLGM